MPFVEKLFPSGDLVISEGFLKRRYSGYSKKEALAKFKREFKTQLRSR